MVDAETIAEHMRCWLSGDTPGPLILDISPTDYCNLRCISCWQRNELFDGKLDSSVYELPDDRLISLIDEAKTLGVRLVEITGGGEPLMRPVVKKLIILVKKVGMAGNLTTNGTLFTKDFVDSLVKWKWDNIVFSIDGPDKESQDTLRGVSGTFDRNQNALSLLKESGSPKPTISFNTVISKLNYGLLSDIIVFAAKNDCRSVNFETLTVHSETGKMIKLGVDDEKKFQESIPKIDAISKRLGVNTNILKFRDTDLIAKSNEMEKIIGKDKTGILNTTCYEPWYHLVIKVDGSAGPCCIATNKDMNIKKRTLSDVWFGPEFKAMRERILKGDMPSFCSICNAGQLFRNKSVRDILLSDN